MRTLPMMFALALLVLAPIGAWNAAASLDEGPWCEVLDHRLVRTNADAYEVNVAIERVLQQNRPAVEDPSELLVACEFEQKLDIWFDDPPAGESGAEVVSRLVRKQIDQEGQLLKIAHIRGQGDEAMIFIEHDSEVEGTEIAMSVAQQLSQRGVTTR